LLTVGHIVSQYINNQQVPFNIYDVLHILDLIDARKVEHITIVSQVVWPRSWPTDF